MTMMTGPDCAVMCNLINIHAYIHTYAQAGANPVVNTPRPSRGTRIESCDFIVLIGGP